MKGLSMPKCKEFSINLALLAPDNKRQIAFGMMRGCLDAETPFHAMIFVLRDLIGGEFQDRVKVEIKLGPAFNDKAEALMKRGLNAAQLDFLQGPMLNRAKKLTATGGATVQDPKMNTMGESMFEK
jgi:hypothetical protein